MENETDEETTMLNVIGEQPNGACEDIIVHGNVESLHKKRKKPSKIYP